jgi:hypothetical protein
MIGCFLFLGYPSVKSDGYHIASGVSLGGGLPTICLGVLERKLWWNQGNCLVEILQRFILLVSCAEVLSPH